MKYYSDLDIVAFATFLGSSTSVSALEAWAATNANYDVLEGATVDDEILCFELLEMISDKITRDPESMKTSAEILYDYIKNTVSSSASTGEPVIIVSGLNYTVSVANGLVQNIIYDHSGGGGTFTLPTTEDADGLTLYVSNINMGTLTFSSPVWETSLVSSTTLPANKRYKLIFDFTDAKWYCINLE